MKKTLPKILFSMLALLVLCMPANADTVLTGFESGTAGFDAGATVGPLGATEGSNALQFASAGGFLVTSSFSFFSELTDPTNDTIKFDVTFTPDDPANTTFALTSFGINSNDGFQFVDPQIGIPIGVTTGVELSFGDLAFPLTSPDLNFAGLLLITNSDGGGVWSFDNISLHTAVVPEPATATLLLGGLMGLCAVRRRKS